MKSIVACLLILAVATQAQWIGNYGYGLSGFGGYHPFGGVRTIYTGFPAGYPAYYGYPSVTTSQYHAQDELGQARFGYAHPGQASTNYRDAFGNQIGSYAYFNPEGKEVRVSYTADHRGFRVLSNDLPVAPVVNLVAPVQVEDTPEVAAAKATHLAAIHAAKTGVAAPDAATPVVGLPVPVQDTAEVAAAKAEHAAKWAAAKAAASPVAAPVAPETTATVPVLTRRKRQIISQGHISPLAYNFASHPFGYNYGAHHMGYNFASPFAYSFGTPFGYNYAHPFAYNYPYYPYYDFLSAPSVAAPVTTARDATVDGPVTTVAAADTPVATTV